MIFNIFRTPIFLSYFKNKEFEKYVQSLLEDSKKNNNLVKISNVGGIQTNIYNEDQKINLIFSKPISTYIESFKRKIDFKWTIKAFWINENRTGDFNKPHEHINPDLHFSAVWYIKVPKESGRIVFINDTKGIDFCKAYKYFDDPIAFSDYYIQPKNGDLIIFPSNTTHYVEPNRSKESRLSVAMNIGLIPL